jgi:Spy/CpxP family protein refolding chaperone
LQNAGLLLTPAQIEASPRGQSESKGEFDVKTKLVLVLVVITAALVSESAVLAQRMPGMRGGGMFGGPMMAAYLGLSQDQMTQLKSLRSSQEAAMRPLMQQLETYRQQLNQMTESPAALDPGALQNLAKEMAAVQTQLTVARATFEWQVFNKVLTADQQAKLTSMRQQMRQMRENWKSNHSTAEPGANQ